MQSPSLGCGSPARLFAGAPRSGFFDAGHIGIVGLPRSPPVCDAVVADVVDLQRQDPSAVGWKEFTSPRQRQGFPRAVNTPSVTFALSPLASDSAFPSPALPFLSPHAAARPKRTARKKPWTVPYSDSQGFWLLLYFAFNLGLTLYNKGVLVRFPFPYTLTSVHALCGTIGGYILRRRRFYDPARLSSGNKISLAVFSVLYAVNIAVSNHSLQLVTVPFHQVVRATTPIFTTLLSMLFFGTQFSTVKLVSLAPVMLGVVLATYGEYYFTVAGLLLTLLGTFLAALKTISANVLQSRSRRDPRPKSRHSLDLRSFLPPRLNLHPLDLLAWMSPLAFIQCVLYAYLSGEFSSMYTAPSAKGVSLHRIVHLLGNGCIAFGLNVVSFTANGRVGPLNMTVAANVKQVLTIILAVAIFDLTITRMNALGIFIALLGGAWYAVVEYTEKTMVKSSRR